MKLGRKILQFLLASFIFLIGIITLEYAKQPHRAYEIILKGVPYNGIYTYDPRVGSAAAAIYSILGYWNSFQNASNTPVQISLEELDSEFHIRRTVRMTELEDFFKSIGYEAKIIRLNSLPKIAQFLEKEQTPLIFFQRPSPQYKGNYGPYRVLIGASSLSKTIIVHDVLFGPAYSMKFDEFQKSYYENQAENLKYIFLVARPINWKELISRNRNIVPYPDRTEYDRLKDLVEKWQEARDLSLSPEEKIAIWEEVFSDPRFNELSPAMRLYAYTGLAENYLALGKLSQAKRFVEKALNLNMDLDKPWGIWTHFRRKEIARPWVRLGQIYFAMKDYNAAHKAFEKAIQLEPKYPDIQTIQELQESANWQPNTL
jgi:tetratricopeptide (TPR) repeat protein